MKINQSDTKSEEMKQFSKHVWKDANREHYGKDILFDDHEIFLTAKEDKTILGMLSARCGNGVIFIREFLVDYTHQRKGIGKALLQELESLAKSKKIHKIYLETGKGWNAEKFYLANGFEKTIELVKHNHKTDFVIYSKFL